MGSRGRRCPENLGKGRGVIIRQWAGEAITLPIRFSYPGSAEQKGKSVCQGTIEQADTKGERRRSSLDQWIGGLKTHTSAEVFLGSAWLIRKGKEPETRCRK